MERLNFFLLYGEYKEQVIRGQVVEHLLTLKRMGTDFQIVFLNFYGSASKQTTENAMACLGVQTTVLAATKPSLPWAIVMDSLRFARHILHQRTHNKVLVHARNEAAAAVAGLSKLFLRSRSVRVKVLFDIRGEAWSEYKFYNRHALKTLKGRIDAILKCLVLFYQRLIISWTADTCIAVSTPLLDRVKIRRRYWMPGYANQKRFYFDKSVRDKKRAQLGLTDTNIVFCYAGSIKHYQEPEAMAIFIKHAFEQLPGSILLLITQNTEEATQIFKDVPQDKVILRSAKYEEVNEYLNAADWGLMIRRPEPINRYSFPTKFLEYLHAGLQVVTTEAVFDAERYVRENGFGHVLSYKSLVEGNFKVEQFSNIAYDKEIVSRASKDKFSEEQRYALYKEIYSLE